MIITVTKKVTKEFYCQFLIAAQTNFTATDFSDHIEDVAHDSVTRFLSNTRLTPNILWEYSVKFVDLTSGYLICDDTVMDHWYGKNIKPAQWLYSGTHHRVVHGIGLTTLLWTDNTSGKHIPVDFRVYAKGEDGFTKNDHFRIMLTLAHNRGFVPKMILFDAWYANHKTLHLINDWEWIFVCGIQSNRNASEQFGKPYQQLKTMDIPKEGKVVHLKDYGSIKIIPVTKKSKVEYLASNNLSFTRSDIRKASARRWRVEEYHRGLKQTVGIAKCQSRKSRSQRTHIFCSILTFLALEKKHMEEGMTWYEAKRRIISDSIFTYLKSPLIPLPQSSPG